MDEWTSGIPYSKCRKINATFRQFHYTINTIFSHYQYAINISNTLSNYGGLFLDSNNIYTIKPLRDDNVVEIILLRAIFTQLEKAK